MRSPAALLASIACLCSAAALSAMLIHDGVAAEPLDPSEGDAVRIQGDLVRFEPGDWSEHIEYALSDATYIVEMDGVADLVLLTGMAEGWEDHTVVADARVVLQTAHPTEPIDILVLAVDDVQEPTFFR